MAKKNLVGKIAGCMGKDIVKAALKYSYPITGNLSNKVRQGLQDRFGIDTFNAEDSADVTLYSNLVTYPLAGYLATRNSLAVPIGIVCALAESNFRFHSDMPYTPGSILGKIVSLPAEYGMDIQKKEECHAEK